MTLSVVTPSHAPDFPSFARLHASVVRHTDPSVRHIVAVPDADVELFRSLGSGRLDVLGERRVLPRRLVLTTPLARIPRLPRGFRVAAVNLARPWPPIRGWILQQLLKLAVVSELESDVAVLIDSDVQVVRPLEESTFRNASGVVRLYRSPGGITDSMTRHLRWQSTALRLLGNSQREVDLPDYISSFSSWDPKLVRACVATVSEQTGGNWLNRAGAELEFSEFILYGTYVMTLAAPESRSFVSAESLCHSYWDPSPLSHAAADVFVSSMKPEDVAILIQSNSGTSEDVLRYVSTRLGSA